MNYYRIFIAEAGDFRDSSKYKYIAEFANQKDASNYVKYIFGKKDYKGKDIIIKLVDGNGLDPKDGCVDGVITSIGESLNVDEFEFF